MTPQHRPQVAAEPGRASGQQPAAHLHPVPPTDPRPVAGLVGVSKTFGGTAAITDVSLDLRAGEVLALLGENGAGKSTCVKILAGVHRPDRGAVHLGGDAVEFRSPQDAQRGGIAVMHQHPGLFPDLTVVENLFIGRQRRAGLGWLDHRAMAHEAQQVLELVGLRRRPDAPLSQLRVSEQQLVEIAKALIAKARVLIMDEPTAALSSREVERLFRVVDDLRRAGVAMMFVGHRMEEVYAVADRIAVLRDGRLIETAPVGLMPQPRALSLMVGRPLSSSGPALAPPQDEVVLEVNGLSKAGEFAAVSFQLRRGEILGLGGLVGSGRTEIARVLFGISPPSAGTLRLRGRTLHLHAPADAVREGIAYVSEDRLGQSLVTDFSILDNAALTVLPRVTRLGLVDRMRELQLLRPHLDRLRLRFHSYDQPVGTLSGGNQQKVVLSKWLATDPSVLILDEPTQGVDVGTKAEVHAMIADLASKGMAIVLISSDMPELLGMSHRIVVLCEGRVTAQLSRGEATQEKVIAAATAGVPTADASPTSAAADARSSASVTPLHRPAQAPSAALWRERIAARAKSALLRRELGLLAVMLAVVVPVWFVNPRILGASNLTALSMDAALLAIVAAAQMLVLLTRNIDLSVASVMGLSAYVAASLMKWHPELGAVSAVAAAAGVGLACGLFNGAIVSHGGLPAIVVTLGTLSIFRGINSLVASGKQISADQVPASWLDMTADSVLGVPALVWIALAILATMALVLRSWPMGRDLYAIGSNPQGAELIGIPARRRVLAAFAVAGVLAGVAGALWASRYATIDSRTAFGYELTVIATVVVGGVAIRGGVGSVAGVVLGALTLLAIRNALILMRVDPLWVQGVYGLVILCAVVLDAAVARRALKAGRNPRRITP
jgi:ABC-type sugar transport system ATPase subunit/ribose/xylose/arabinose/galactoside ABC-type transport system permease subunit